MQSTFNAVSIKIPVSFSAEIEKILQITWNHKGLHTAKNS